MKYSVGTIHDIVVRELKPYFDSRGWLMELFREDEMQKEHFPAMAYLSETLPGVVRGPHEHQDQTDYFVFAGPGTFRLYLWDARVDSPSYGSQMILSAGEGDRKGVIVPPGVVHAYKNISAVPGWVYNAPNRLYAGRNRAEKVDEIRHEEIADSPFRMD